MLVLGCAQEAAGFDVDKISLHGPNHSLARSKKSQLCEAVLNLVHPGNQQLLLSTQVICYFPALKILPVQQVFHGRRTISTQHEDEIHDVRDLQVAILGIFEKHLDMINKIRWFHVEVSKNIQ